MPAEPLGPPKAPSPVLHTALADAVSQARQALETSDPVRAVHDLRKAFKRLRALLRLVQAAPRAEAAVRKHARHLRTTLSEDARHLSGTRDMAALRDAMDDLVAKQALPLSLYRTALRAFSRRREGQEKAGLEPYREKLAATLDDLNASLPTFGSLLDAKSLPTALAREYGKARAMGRRVTMEDPETLHDLRKSVVAQRYQMELAVPPWSALGRTWVDELQRLRERLGKYQDLSVLIERTQPPAFTQRRPAPWRAVLLKAARERQATLAMSALRLHALLFAEKPEAFRRRMRAYMATMATRD